MLNELLGKVFGSQHERDVKRMEPTVAEINALEPEMQALSDEALRAKTDELKAQVADGAKLDDLLVPAFAVAREGAVRAVGMRPYDVQLIGGIVLHGGKIAEMKTGEGKTLVATLPVYLNALLGKGVHVVTVNDYLASRDAEWMGQVHRWLGLDVGLVVPGERDPAYKRELVSWRSILPEMRMVTTTRDGRDCYVSLWFHLYPDREPLAAENRADFVGRIPGHAATWRDAMAKFQKDAADHPGRHFSIR